MKEKKRNIFNDIVAIGTMAVLFTLVIVIPCILLGCFIAK